jgi:hypothetical protein
MAATGTIPIVMVHGAPLQMGVIDSLARPGGNVTGLSMIGRGDWKQTGAASARANSEPNPDRSYRHDCDHNPIRDLTSWRTCA